MSTSLSKLLNSPSSSSADHNNAVEAQLDALMPKPASRWVRWLLGMVLIVGTLGFGWLAAEGMVVPRPTSNGSWGGSQSLSLADDGSTATAVVSMPNWSGRTVRVTEVLLDHEDVTLLGVQAWFEPPTNYGPGDCATSADGRSTICVADSPADRPDAPQPMFALPMSAPPGDGRLMMQITFAPTDCASISQHTDGPTLGPRPVGDQPGEAWGDVRVRVDFGEGAFPPFSRTILLDDQLSELYFAVPDEPNATQSGSTSVLSKMCELSSQ